MTATEDDGSTADAEVAIHRVLSRGARAEAQVLLVLVSSAVPPPHGDAIFVTAGPGKPQRLWANTPSECTEAARPIDWAELETLDLLRADDAAPFDLDRTMPRWFGLARFDLSDHPWLEWHWGVLCQPADGAAPAALEVTAWRARLGHDHNDGSAADAWLPDGPSEHIDVALADVVVQPLFELGVLFVHGIGNHEPRETLVLWAEPIVAFWRERARAICALAAEATAHDERERLRLSVTRGQLRNRAPLDGVSEALADYAKPMLRETPPPRATATVPRPCVVAVRPEQTVFSSPDPAQPSAALWRISSIDSAAVLRESHVLLAEAHWTREAFPPTFGELFTWLITAVPVAVWARMQRLVVQRPADLKREFRAARGVFDGVRWMVALMLLLAQLVGMPAAYVVGAWVVQLAAGLTGLAGVLVPIPWVRSTARTVMNALLSTIGQSQALQSSPLRRSAIVSAVENRLDWVSARCQRVVVMAHSQGAEITRRVFAERRRPNLARWFTFGAGIAPLAMLSPKSLAKPRSVAVVAASLLGLVGLAAVVIGLAIDRVPGVQLGLWPWLSAGWHALSWQALALWYAGLSAYIVVLTFAAGGPDVAPRLRRSVIEKWCDVYASHDPVPAGSLIDRFRDDLKRQQIPEPPQRRIFNTRFALLDHTSYFRNVEQFVAPIALELLRLAGLGAPEDAEAPTLKLADQWRDWLTWWTMFGTVTTLFAAVGTAAWLAFGPAQRAQAWMSAARLLWGRPVGVADRLAAFWSEGWVGAVAVDLWPALAVLLVLAVLAVARLAFGRLSGQRLVKRLAAAARGQK